MQRAAASPDKTGSYERPEDERQRLLIGRGRCSAQAWGKGELVVPARAIPGFCHGRGRKRWLQEGGIKRKVQTWRGKTHTRYTMLLRSCLRSFWTPGTPGTHLLPQHASVRSMWKVHGRCYLRGICSRSLLLHPFDQAKGRNPPTRPFLVRHCSHTLSQFGRILTSYFLISLHATHIPSLALFSHAPSLDVPVSAICSHCIHTHTSSIHRMMLAYLDGVPFSLFCNSISRPTTNFALN